MISFFPAVIVKVWDEYLWNGLLLTSPDYVIWRAKKTKLYKRNSILWGLHDFYF